jgi:hypothetical protein
VNVFGIDGLLPRMEVANKSIEWIKKFLYDTMKLLSTLAEIGIDNTNLEIIIPISNRNSLITISSANYYIFLNDDFT